MEHRQLRNYTEEMLADALSFARPIQTLTLVGCQLSTTTLQLALTVARTVHVVRGFFWYKTPFRPDCSPRGRRLTFRGTKGIVEYPVVAAALIGALVNGGTVVRIWHPWFTSGPQRQYFERLARWQWIVNVRFIRGNQCMVLVPPVA